MQQKEIKAILDKHQPKLDLQYAQNLQISKYTNLSDIENSQFFQDVGLNKEQNCLIYFIEGEQQCKFSNEIITYQLIKTLDSKIENSMYSLIYFVAETNSSSELGRFRQILKHLPLKYYVRLHSFYVHHASLLVRAKLLFSSSKRGKIWLKRTTFVGDLDILFKSPLFQPCWIQCIPNRLVNKSIQQEKIQQQLQIQQVPKVYGQAIQFTKLNQYGIPIIVDNLLLYFVSNQDYVTKQDLFRKSGSIDDEKQLFEWLNQEFYDCLKVVDDPYLVGSMLKKYFTMLPEPIIPDVVFQLILNSFSSSILFNQDVKQDKEETFLEAILSSLPCLNRVIFQVLVSFIIYVSTFSEKNRMNQENLARVFAPCFIRTEVKDLSALTMIGVSIEFLKVLFTNFEIMYPKFSFRLFLNEKQNILTSTSSSNSSTGPDTSNKNNSETSDDQDVNK